MMLSIVSSVSPEAAPAVTVAGASFPHVSSQNTSDPLAQPLEGKQMQTSRGPYARKFRGNNRNVLRNTDVAEKVREVANATYDGDASKAKAFAEDAASSPRAAENWLAGDNPMSLTAFLNAYHNNPTFKAWARKILLMEQDHDPEFQADLAKFIRSVQQRVQP